MDTVKGTANYSGVANSLIFPQFEELTHDCHTYDSQGDVVEDIHFICILSAQVVRALSGLVNDRIARQEGLLGCEFRAVVALLLSGVPR